MSEMQLCLVFATLTTPDTVTWFMSLWVVSMKLDYGINV